MSSPHFDVLAEHQEIEQLRRDEALLDERFARLSRRLFATVTGREWLRHALARYNFMGSVFAAEDGMDPIKAAVREGRRSLLSDILNSAFTAQPNDDDDEDPHVPDPPPVR
jgi:hypothetical protein